MAWVSKERKDIISAALGNVLPKKAGWKYTLAGVGSGTLRLRITQGPIDLIGNIADTLKASGKYGDAQMVLDDRYFAPNEYYLQNSFSGDTLVLMEKVKAAMNVGNHNNSDISSDYFDVGWYIDIIIGKSGDPFLDIVPAGKAKFKKYVDDNLPKWKLEKYLPQDFKYLSAGKKAAATKKAKQLAAQFG
jgi:hypothetical protein